MRIALAVVVALLGASPVGAQTKVPCAVPAWGGEVGGLAAEESVLAFAMMAMPADAKYVAGAGASSEDWRLYMDADKRCELAGRYAERLKTVVKGPKESIVEELSVAPRRATFLKKDKAERDKVLRQAYMLHKYLLAVHAAWSKGPEADGRTVERAGAALAKRWADDLAGALGALRPKPDRKMAAPSAPSAEAAAPSASQADSSWAHGNAAAPPKLPAPTELPPAPASKSVPAEIRATPERPYPAGAQGRGM